MAEPRPASEAERALSINQQWSEIARTLRGVFELHPGRVLVLALGSGAEALSEFTATLARILPSSLSIRSFVFSADNLNPLIDAQRGVDRGQYVTLAHGLAQLTPEQRQRALTTLNNNRGLMGRGGVKFILWVEPEIYQELNRFAGDFADWWTELVDVPLSHPVWREPLEIQEENLRRLAEEHREFFMRVAVLIHHARGLSTQRMELQHELDTIQGAPPTQETLARIQELQGQIRVLEVEFKSDEESLSQLYKEMEVLSARKMHLMGALAPGSPEDRDP